jgi:Co/Zn/Cd efflux system component
MVLFADGLHMGTQVTAFLITFFAISSRGGTRLTPASVSGLESLG